MDGKSSLQGREILLGVTGGVAAYKAADLCSQLVQLGANVSVILTQSASSFVGPTTFQALTRRPVHSDALNPIEHFQGEHIGLPRRAELFVIAPCTAQTLARLAHGFADDLLSTAVLAAVCPLIIAPAMNCDMWAKPAVQRNVAQLRQDGVDLIEPEDGWLSCGQVGAGRMAAPDRILQRIQLRFQQNTSQS